ncbi:MAG: hypothetical protein LJE68_03540 [Rhodobacter sp.]|nr:hypothetical protein [Rhodobacter sp.]
MAGAKILRIYLDEVPFLRAERGNFNIINKIRAAFESRGFRVELKRNSDVERLKSATRRGYSLFHMDDPFHPRALTLRKAYFYPFWRIETSAKRWEWEIARTGFDAGKIDPIAARTFCDRWRRTLFPKAEPLAISGFVYVPLQGRLLEQRSFQSASPVDMIRQILLYEPARDVIAGLHPGEIYTPEETDTLNAMVDAMPRLHLSDAPMARLLAGCDYVVTENSSVALSGYFMHKPAVLFAKIDFHHIAANVESLGVQDAIGSAPQMRPEYDRYLFWFLKQTAINGGAPEVESQILDAVRRKGWDI